MNTIAQFASRLVWADRLALFVAAFVGAAMLLLFVLTVLAAGGLGVGRYAIYFGTLALQAEVLIVGPIWVMASLLHQMFGSMHAQRTRAVAVRRPAPSRARTASIGAFRF